MAQRFLAIWTTLMLVSCQVSLAAQQARWQQQVNQLTHSFSTLEALRVEAYRNQDWCQNIAYRRGKFSDNIASSTCNLFRGTPQSFDAQSQQDFETLTRTMTSTGVNVRYISNLRYAADGSLKGAEFTLRNGHEYVFAPGYETLPEDIPQEREYQAINQDWYFVRNDWN